MAAADRVTADNGGLRSPAEHVVFPPVVYVPCAAVQDAGSDLVVDLRPTRDGRVALLVYSALDRLVACCGPQQPWTLMAAASLEDVRLATGFDLVLLDVEIPEEHRHSAEDLR
jgi:hypothetical protein